VNRSRRDRRRDGEVDDDPGLAERLGDGVRGTAALIWHPQRLLSEAKAIAELVLRDELIPAPHKSLNVPIGPHRRYAVVLAAATGGLRRLLQERDEERGAPDLRALRDGIEESLAELRAVSTRPAPAARR
jgi:hypothetical protein